MKRTKPKFNTNDLPSAALCPACLIPLRIVTRVSNGTLVALYCNRCEAHSNFDDLKHAKRILKLPNISADSKIEALENIQKNSRPFHRPDPDPPPPVPPPEANAA